MGDNYTDSEEEKERKKRYSRKQPLKKPTSPESPKDPESESYVELYNSVSSTIGKYNLRILVTLGKKTF